VPLLPVFFPKVLIPYVVLRRHFLVRVCVCVLLCLLLLLLMEQKRRERERGEEKETSPANFTADIHKN